LAVQFIYNILIINFFINNKKKKIVNFGKLEIKFTNLQNNLNKLKLCNSYFKFEQISINLNVII
jgi:hypothetical protein